MSSDTITEGYPLPRATNTLAWAAKGEKKSYFQLSPHGKIISGSIYVTVAVFISASRHDSPGSGDRGRTYLLVL